MDIRTMTESSLTEADTQPRGMMQERITSKEIKEATNILRKYKEGKARLEQKIISNEEFWKLRQWKRGSDEGIFTPATAWLWNCIQGRHSDAMDSFPTCNFRPRQQDDKAEAERLSSIVPIVLEQNRYEETYSDIVWYMLKHGGCIQGVFWEGAKNNGLGDVTIKMVDFLNIFWEPGVKDIQESDNVFTVELVNNKLLEQRYPQTVGHLGGKKITVAKYLYDDSIDTSGKSVVVDWYYHTEYNGKRVLQYCKFVNDVVLFATENDPAMAERGYYDHGMYPFVVQDLYPVEGSICGYGLTDIGRDAQIQIDILNKAVTDCAYVQAAPRYFYRDDGSVNEAQLRDVTQQLIRVEGSLDETHLKPMDYKPLSATVLNELQSKIDELKQVTSNQDANNGVAPSGITAASAIAALQETAGKNSRATNKAFYRAYRNVVYLVVELIRQFYDVPRTFRISPDSIDETFVQYNNAGLKGQPQVMASGQEMGLRLPEFDIDVTAEKQSPYKKIEQNELALNFYQQGFFNPQMADQALSCLEMMDFEGKDDVIERVRANGTLQEMLLQFEQIAMMLAQKYEPAMADQIAQMVLQAGGQETMPLGGGDVDLDKSTENPMVERARQQARESTQIGV